MVSPSFNMPNIFQKIFSGGAGEIVDKVAGAVDRFVQTKEEKDAVNLEISNKHLMIH